MNKRVRRQAFFARQEVSFLRMLHGNAHGEIEGKHSGGLGPRAGDPLLPASGLPARNAGRSQAERCSRIVDRAIILE
jgi:hypothetical protein